MATPAFSRGAGLNRADRHGVTALLDAAETGDLETVRYLQQQKTDLRARDHVGDTALTRAALGYAAGYPAADRNTGLLQFLLDSGLDVNHRSRDGLTSLMAAARLGNGDLAAFRLLLARGADPNARDVEGKSALDWTTEFDRPAVRALLGKPAVTPGPRPAAAPAAKRRQPTKRKPGKR